MNPIPEITPSRTPLFSPLKISWRSKTLADLPQHILCRMSVKLYLLSSLTWDYVDTVLEIASGMKIAETRRLSREVKALRQEHDRLYSILDVNHEGEISRLGELFETVCREHLNRMYLSFRNEILAIAEPSADYMLFLQAIQAAMTMVDALYLYGVHFDSYLRDNGVIAPRVLSSIFDRLAILLPAFAVECFDFTTASPARKLTALILANELIKIEISEYPPA